MQWVEEEKNPINKTVVINSINRVSGSADAASYNINWQAFLGRGRYKLTWKYLETIPNPFKQLLLTKIPWGRYDAANWSGTSLPDSSGNGRHAVTSVNMAFGTSSGNGASGIISSIGGGVTTTIQWPAGSLPTNFTIASLSRYNTGIHTRVIQAASNWFQGHWNDKRGVMFYQTFLTTLDVGTRTNWLGVVGKNSGTFPGNILIDGVASGTAAGGVGNSTLNINIGGETSDYEFSQLIIWDQILTDTEMLIVGAAINTYLSTGIMQ